MTYSQPQQQQQNYRPNRAALWVNDRKSAANQPDYKGNLEISHALFQELAAAFNAGQYQQDNGGQPCIKLDFALYAQQGGVSATGRARPILSGQLSTVAETQQSAAMRQQAAAQYQQAPQQPQPQYAPAPVAPAPMPQAAPQPAYQQPAMPQAPAPMAPPAPAQPMPGAIHGQAPVSGARGLPPGF